MKPWLAGLLAAAALAVEPGPTAAQPIDEDELYIPEFRSAGRKLVGAGFGIGMFDGRCAECPAKGGLAIELYGGWQLHPRLAVLADVGWTVHPLPADGDNPGLAGYLSATAAAQVWIVPQLYIRLGLGAGAVAIVASGGSSFDPGPGLILSVGGELGHRPDSGIDLSLRGAGSQVNPDAAGEFLFFSAGALVGYHRN
jgi:hypothetical protein